MTQKERKAIREKAISEFIAQHEIENTTALEIQQYLPEAIRIYKKMWKAGNSYEAIKAEIKSFNWGIGGWLYQLADECCQQEL